VESNRLPKPCRDRAPIRAEGQARDDPFGSRYPRDLEPGKRGNEDDSAAPFGLEVGVVPHDPHRKQGIHRPSGGREVPLDTEPDLPSVFQEYEGYQVSTSRET